MKPSSALLTAALVTGNLFAQADRWEPSDDGGIRTDLAKLTQGKDHADHIEMAGRSVNAIIRWKISAEGRMDLDRWVRWPMLREKKDDTHASANAAFRSADEPRILVDGAPYQTGTASDFNIYGTLSWTERTHKLAITRTIFPAVHLPCLLERWEIHNNSQSLVLKTGNDAVDRLFAFSKLRAAENVLATRGGLMHAPGGFNRYLAAIWCNDQNEYVSPFFPFLGDAAGNESARNAYQWFAKFMNPEFCHIPSSVVAEGRSTWGGAGDRGDAAMTAYGAARWALATGDESLAREVWPFIEWCLEFCERKKTADGVIASDRDELEGRFSAGKTNLATSTLTYDALLSSADLAEALGEPAEKAALYRKRAAELKVGIEKVFGATVNGHETYRYHEGLEKVRSWICLPLTMDIFDRSKGTIDALFSPDLWTKDGLLTEAGGKTFWDRSTLYALRGVFRAGDPDRAAEYLDRYARRRLLGDHVPYCVEAFPEQNQSHLSAESGLYCRIFTEGVCGIRPTGFNAFTAIPRLPKAWPGMQLTKIRAFSRTWDYLATRKLDGIQLTISAGGQAIYQETKPDGEEHKIQLP